MNCFSWGKIVLSRGRLSHAPLHGKEVGSFPLMQLKFITQNYQYTNQKIKMVVVINFTIGFCISFYSVGS